MVLLPHDTDVLIAVLHYREDFTSIGFNELWMQFGTGKSKRFIPEHKLLIQSSPQLYSNFIKCNVLTETDSTRKGRTKFTALKSGPNEYLQNFDQMIAWKHNFKILKNLKSTSSNFDDLRYEQEMKKLSLVKFPLTSSVNT